MIEVVSHQESNPEARMATPTDPKQYLDIRELSARTGVSVTTLRRYVKEGKIEALQPGGRGGKLLFRLNALERLAPRTSASPPAGAGPNRLSGRQPAWMNSPPHPPNVQLEGG